MSATEKTEAEYLVRAEAEAEAADSGSTCPRVAHDQTSITTALSRGSLALRRGHVNSSHGLHVFHTESFSATACLGSGKTPT
jgi:hypothetical protein